MLKKTLALLLLLTAAISGLAATPAYVVIVNPANSNSLTDQDIADIYLGKTRQFPDGLPANPVDRHERNPMRIRFINEVVGKNEVQFKRYWARLIFTGRATPPKILTRDEAVLEYVRQHPGGIGIIDARNLDDSVRVVRHF